MTATRGIRLLGLIISLLMLGSFLMSCGSQEAPKEAAKEKAPPAAGKPAAPGSAKTAADYINQGKESLKSKEYDYAIASFGAALKLEPQSIQAYNNRGIAYCEKGDFDNAIADFSKVIEIDPKHGKAYNNRAVAYLMKGERDKARQDVEKAQSLGIAVNQMLIDSLHPAAAKTGEPALSPTMEKLPPGVTMTPVRPEDLPKPGGQVKPEAQPQTKPKPNN